MANLTKKMDYLHKIRHFENIYHLFWTVFTHFLPQTNFIRGHFRRHHNNRQSALSKFAPKQYFSQPVDHQQRPINNTIIQNQLWTPATSSHQHSQFQFISKFQTTSRWAQKLPVFADLQFTDRPLRVCSKDEGFAVESTDKFAGRFRG